MKKWGEVAEKEGEEDMLDLLWSFLSAPSEVEVFGVAMESAAAKSLLLSKPLFFLFSKYYQNH